MAIVASKGSSFTPCPGGSYPAICCDVVDLGVVKTNYQGKTKSQHKVAIVWQTPEIKDDGKPHLVKKRYTLSLHEKATLRKDLESWRGRAFAEDELNGFDLEALLSAPCMLSVVQVASNGNVYANVSAIMKIPKGVPAPNIDPSYIRMQDRPEEGDRTDAPPDTGEWQADDSDVPF